jgi:H+-transporting ATPase
LQLTDPSTGLTKAEAEARKAQYGPNQLPEKKVNPVLMFLNYFIGPMPIMIWIAIIVEGAIQGE